MPITRYFAIAAIALFLVACNKKSDKTETLLDGKWELITIESVWTGRQTFQRGNGNTFTFKDNTYTRNFNYIDTSYQTSGTFSVFQGKACEMAKERILIKFDNDQYASYFSRSGRTFTIASPFECVIDGGDITYRKISP
jgi:hypothetical protein